MAVSTLLFARVVLDAWDTPAAPRFLASLGLAAVDPGA